MEFAGKVVLITGASSGIGRETAKRFAKLGAQLVIAGMGKKQLDETSNSCKEINKIEPLAIEGNLESGDHIKTLIDSTIKKFKRLDVLVNNAGIMPMGTIENTSLEQYNTVFNVNVRSVYHLTMLAVPYLIETKGSIVNLSSICGIRSFPNILAYCMSKSAIDQFTKCVALELGPKKVRVNAVSPGVILTNLQRSGGMNEKQYAEFLEHSKETHALGRVGEPREVADTIIFLASGKASFITGVNVPVDGGKHAMCPR